MKRIIIFLTLFVVTAAFPLRAQDVTALEERVKQLNGYVQDLIEDKANQKRQIELLAREVQTLREQQQNQPKTSYASQEDLRGLAKQVQEIETNRKTDREVILKAIEKIAKTPVKVTPPPPRANAGSSQVDLPEKAVEHTIAPGDTLSTIAAAYSKEMNAKITTELILKANDGIDPKKLKVGQKILIPLP
ncbi:MAG: LysM domain-containing protein [Verrucomicrobiota bacterium]|nr:LysM peptidoglycan-binding domain-containing protein [Verrucomicrobiota bacterium]MCC6822905.1 LysM peptidoglycan-binding domain-containing protein [Limisphaerales bacterium]